MVFKVCVKKKNLTVKKVVQEIKDKITHAGKTHKSVRMISGYLDRFEERCTARSEGHFHFFFFDSKVK